MTMLSKAIFSTTVILTIIFLGLFTSPLFGATVQLNISDKLIANAEYYPGEKNRPFILIMHGFLLNHNFPTVKRLAESLNSSGYNILTPSLTLGINQRKKSLACEAIHTHSLKKDVSELDQWIKWLQKKTSGEIILIGHSTGSIHLAKFLSNHPSDRIKEIIFIAMPDLNPNFRDNETINFEQKAKQLVLNNDMSLHDFKIAYCEKYPTTAENYLSYLQLSKENILNDLDKITVPKTLIMGSKDNRINESWRHTLLQHGVNVISIEGANHFFDYEYEFDLLDIVENILSQYNTTTKK